MNEPVRKWYELSKKTKLRVHDSIVVPTLMYGIETWVVNKQQVSKNRMMDRVRNVEIRVKLKQEGVLEKGKRSQVR